MLSLALVLLLTCLFAGGASAQVPAERPAGTQVDVAPPASRRRAREPRQTMMLTVSLYGANTDDSARGETADSRALSGFHNDADALLTYMKSGRRTSLGLSARSVLRHDPGRGALTMMHDQGVLEVSARGSRTGLHATQTLGYSPYYQFGALPDIARALPGETDSVAALSETAQAHGDYANARLAAYDLATAVDLSRAIGRRSALSLSYARRQTTFEGADRRSTAQIAAFRLTRQLTRRASLRAGYGYQSAGHTLTDTPSARGHDLGLGVDYNRALTFSKRTTFRVGTGSSALTQERRTAYGLSLDAALTRTIGRTWSAGLTYRRGLQLLEGFAAPGMSDAVSASLRGMLSRRLAVSSFVGWSTGEVGLTRDGRGYGSVTSAAGLRLALTRRSTLEAQYFSYQHRFADSVVLAPGLPRRLTRQGLRIGVTWRAPLLHGKEAA